MYQDIYSRIPGKQIICLTYCVLNAYVSCTNQSSLRLILLGILCYPLCYQQLSLAAFASDSLNSRPFPVYAQDTYVHNTYELSTLLVRTDHVRKTEGLAAMDPRYPIYSRLQQDYRHSSIPAIDSKPTIPPSSSCLRSSFRHTFASQDGGCLSGSRVYNSKYMNTAPAAMNAELTPPEPEYQDPIDLPRWVSEARFTLRASQDQTQRITTVRLRKRHFWSRVQGHNKKLYLPSVNLNLGAQILLD